MTEKKPLELTLSHPPHIRSTDSVTKIMWLVVASLMPATIYSVYIYGIKALTIIIASILAAVLSEFIFKKLVKRPVTILDGSAVITGLLIAMNVPPEAPVWMVIVGSAFAIIIVKELFGGLGFNIFNPALAARAFMLASWPVYMTTKWYKFGDKNILAENIKNTMNLPTEVFDAITAATPLSVYKAAPQFVKDFNINIDQVHSILFSPEMLKSLFIGNVGGVIGETSALLLLLGGLFLLYKKIITWHIPVSFIGTVALLAFIYYSATGRQYPYLAIIFHSISGGLFLGAFFMATDMVTSPITAKGMIIFGAGAGVITFVIRIFGGYPEGVSYAILLMNSTVPLIDRFTKPKIFGKKV